MKRNLLVALAVLVTSSIPATLAAAVIDDFSAPGVVGNIVTIIGGPNPASATTVDGSILGGARTITAQIGTVTPGVYDTSNILVIHGAGGFNFNSSGPTGGFVEIDYGTHAMGGLALGDLATGGGQFTFDFNFLDSNNTATTIPIEIQVSTATGALSFTGAIPVNMSPFQFTAPFASFVGPGSFSNVNGVTFIFNGFPGSETDTDFSFAVGSNGIGFGPLPVPEPASLIGWSVLVGAGLLLRRRQISI